MTPTRRSLKILMLESYALDAEQTAGVIFDTWGDKVELRRFDRVKKALSCLKKERAFDVILLDLLFPGSQGLKTFVTVRECAGDIPMIVFSGLPMLRKDHEFLKAEAFEVLRKGVVDTRVFIATLRQAIETRSLNRLASDLPSVLSA